MIQHVILLGQFPTNRTKEKTKEKDEEENALVCLGAAVLKRSSSEESCMELRKRLAAGAVMAKESDCLRDDDEEEEEEEEGEGGPGRWKSSSSESHIWE